MKLHSLLFCVLKSGKVAMKNVLHRFNFYYYNLLYSAAAKS